jgi:PAS domain S-box-containing protein
LSTNSNRSAAALKSSSVVQFPEQPALQLIYDTAPIGLACLSPDCRYLQINQRLTEICGISVEDHLGRTVRDCVPGLADAVDGIVRSIMETGDPVTGIEVAGQRADQTDERFWITYWHPLRSPSGEIVGINVAAEEITERKRAEAALRETQNYLIEAEKLAALGRLVAGVAHEVNTPIGTGLTVASSLERRTAAFAAEAAQGSLRRSSLIDFVETTREASSQLVANLKHAAELIQSFKQVAADRDYSDQRMFDLGDLTEQIVVSLRPGLGNLTLNVACEPNLKINSYPGRYGQLLTNLFMNSVTHAFPDGSGGTIDIKVRAAGDDAVNVIFSDDGCGMSPDVRRKAFDPFFTTRRDLGSTGLGLHIVHAIVTNYLGGRLHLESKPGKGTKIRLLLPRATPPAPGN